LAQQGETLLTEGGEKPLAQEGKEPLAREGKEPSAKEGKEPSAKEGKEPLAEEGEKPPAKKDKAPSVQQEKSPTGENDKTPSATASKPASATGKTAPSDDTATTNPPQPEPSAMNKAATSNTPTSAASPQNRSATIAVAAAVIAVTSLAGTAWLWQQGQAQQLQTQADLKAAFNQQQQQAAANRELQQQVDAAKLAQAQWQQQTSDSVEQLQSQLASNKRKLQSLSTTDRDDWLLAEAEYLIRLANQRLLMGKEIAGAHALLKAADEIARELDDSALFPVRQALANDMASLRAAGKLDVEGLYLELGALAKQAGELRLFAMPQLTEPAPVQTASADTWQQRFENGLRAAWQKLAAYIQIKRRDEHYQPILAPEYEAAVRQNLQLMFEQAQMALLSGRQQLYNDSLAKAQQWLNDYYTVDPAPSAALVAQINSLARQKVAVELPDISASLRALKHYVDTVHNVDTVAPQTGDNNGSNNRAAQESGL
jgi:uroporphyrin-3 C-methyltransferase